MLLLWLKNPNCKSTAKECNADARLRLIIETIGNNNRYPTYKGLQRQNITRNLRFTTYIYIHIHIYTYIIIYIYTYTDIHSVSSNVRFTVCTPLRRWMSPSLPIGEGLAGESAGVELWRVPTALFFFGENDGNKYGI
jgi:hypothetical protein